MGCLYILTFPNGKQYVGITTKTAEKRFAAHCYEAGKSSKRTSVLHRAINVHGPESVDVQTIAFSDDWNCLCDLERQAIGFFETRSPLGYNLTDGGDGASPGSKWHLGFRHTDEQRRRWSLERKGYKHTDEAKAKIAAAGLGNEYGLGRRQSSAERLMRSLAQTGIAKGASSGHVGVSWHKGAHRWRAHITRRGKFKHLGFHSTLKEAILARRSEEERGRQNGCQTTA